MAHPHAISVGNSACRTDLRQHFRLRVLAAIPRKLERIIIQALWSTNGESDCQQSKN
jgi:hypothetical protein